MFLFTSTAAKLSQLNREIYNVKNYLKNNLSDSSEPFHLQPFYLAESSGKMIRP